MEGPFTREDEAHAAAQAVYVNTSDDSIKSAVENMDNVIVEQRNATARLIELLTLVKTERDALTQSVAERDETIKKLTTENTNLRAALAFSKEPCVYCTLPAEEQSKCAHGFPGCARADDQMGCPHFAGGLAHDSLSEAVMKATQNILTGILLPISKADDFDTPLGRLETIRMTLARSDLFVDFGQFEAYDYTWAPNTLLQRECGTLDELETAYNEALGVIEDALDAVKQVKFDPVHQYHLIEAVSSWETHFYALESLDFENVLRLSRVLVKSRDDAEPIENGSALLFKDKGDDTISSASGPF